MRAMIFDTETTGLIGSMKMKNEQLPEIIEFSALEITLSKSNGNWQPEEIRQTTHLFKPSKPLPEDITRITGLTDKDLEGQQAFSAQVHGISNMLRNAEVLIAHNLRYDLDMLRIEYRRLGEELPVPPVLVCTVEQTLHFKRHRLNLTALHEHLFGVKPAEAHRAAQDVRTLYRCAAKLLEMGEIKL